MKISCEWLVRTLWGLSCERCILAGVKFIRAVSLFLWSLDSNLLALWYYLNVRLRLICERERFDIICMFTGVQFVYDVILSVC